MGFFGIVIAVLLIGPLVTAGATNGAQDASVAVVQSQDPPNDVRTTNEVGPNQTLPRDAGAHLDIIEAWASADSAEWLEFGLRFNGGPPRGGEESRAYRIAFSYDAVDYEVRGAFPSTGCPAGLVRSEPPTQEWTLVQCLDEEVSGDGAQVVVTVPFHAVTNESRIPLQPGASLSGIVFEGLLPLRTPAAVQEVVGFLPGAIFIAKDRAPDTGRTPPVQVPPLAGEGAGPIFLSAPDPIRVSNGESTTMVYKVMVTNRAESEGVALLRASTDEAGFSTRVPPRVTVAPGQTVEVPVLVSMEFSHQHGGEAFVRVAAVDPETDAEMSEVYVGVHWLTIAQPAGHHNVLYPHSADPQVGETGRVTPKQVHWLNTVREDPDPAATEAPVIPDSGQGPNGGTIWRFPLRPSLQMGLELENEEEGQATVAIQTTYALEGARFNASLVVCTPGGKDGGRHPACEPTDAARVLFHGASDSFAVDPLDSRQETFVLRAVGGPSTVEYDSASNLVLLVELVSQTPGRIIGGPAEELHLLPDQSEVVMPLREYHDPIDQGFHSIGVLRLTGQGHFDRLVNPGRTVVYDFLAENTGERDLRVQPRLFGQHSEWATWHPSQPFELSAGANASIQLAVVAPEDASHGERAELFVVLEDVDDPMTAVLARVRASVTTQADIEDEAGLLSVDGQGGRSPGPGAFPIVLAVALAAAAVRRPPGRRNP